MQSALKAIVKRLVYHGGLLSLLHRRRNRDTLTVVLFHRVLARSDPRWPSALPDWTVSDTFFEQCLAFFRRHYHVVTLAQVTEAASGGTRLPPRSLLITFDDGYADNAEYALPLLERHGLPAAVFVYSRAVGSATRPWTEDLAAAYLGGSISDAQVRTLARALDPGVGDLGTRTQVWIGELAARWPALDDQTLHGALSAAGISLERPSVPAQMMSEQQLRRASAAGMAVGAHGATHTALTRVEDLSTELEEPRSVLARMLGVPEDDVNTLAFPYGMHDDRVIARARDAGYELLFLLLPEIVPLVGGHPTTRVLPRVNVSESDLANDGAVDPVTLALHFFRLPHARSA